MALCCVTPRFRAETISKVIRNPLLVTTPVKEQTEACSLASLPSVAAWSALPLGLFFRVPNKGNEKVREGSKNKLLYAGGT